MKRLVDFSSRFRILKGGKVSLVVSALLGSVVIASASPSGGTVTSGTANISQSGKVTNIDQSSSKASINWQNFDIATDETVNFNQPDINSITLNRVVGNESSVINGALNANGQVWLLNSNGVLFGKNASVNTAGILVTTGELSDSDFQAGNYKFKNNSENSVINLGAIEVSNNGSVILAASEVRNSGTIKAVKGKVHLTGASEYTVNLNGNSLVNLIVDKGVLDAMVENSGTILADGGEVYLTTNAVNELLKGVVNNTGIIEANSLDGLMGNVEVFAHGGEVQVGGTIEAKDGFVETSGKDFTILEDATITAGEWLIDPVNVNIDDTLATTIETALGSGDVTIETDQSSYTDVDTSSNESGTDGDINVNSEIEWSTANKLTLDASNDININAEITATAGKLALYYGDSGDYNVNAKVNLSAGENFFTKQTSDVAATTWTVITELGTATSNNDGTLQGINGNLTGNYVLGSEINASDTSTWNSGKGFDPLGDTSTQFAGSFDGLGHTISNLTINRPNEDFLGLFGRTNGATIKNIGVTNISITGEDYIGGLLGYNNNSTIENSYVSGTVSGEGNSIGGLLGYNNSVISNSYASGTVEGNDNVGGLVGNNSNGIITNAYATGAVNGASSVGGLVGYNSSGTITNAYATGAVNGTSGFVAGLIGYNYYGTITNSYATGAVSGDTYVGGLVGYTFFRTITNSYATGAVSGDTNVGGLVGYTFWGTITNSYATGAVSGETNVGGLVAYNNQGTITNSYATGAVSGDTYVGGLVGNNHYNGTIANAYATGTVSGSTNVGGLVGSNIGTITNSFWDTQTTGQTSSSGSDISYGKTTNELQTIDIFKTAGWNIELDSSKTKIYPFLVFDENGEASWKIGLYNSIVEAANDTTSDTTNDTNRIITAITNTTAVKTNIPKVENLVIKTNVSGSQILENENTKVITMSELKAKEDTNSENVNQDIVVPLSDNSLVSLVNGGVNLPEGVDQQFFVANTDTQEN